MEARKPDAKDRVWLEPASPTSTDSEATLPRPVLEQSAKLQLRPNATDLWMAKRAQPRYYHCIDCGSEYRCEAQYREHLIQHQFLDICYQIQETDDMRFEIEQIRNEEMATQARVVSGFCKSAPQFHVPEKRKISRSGGFSESASPPSRKISNMSVVTSSDPGSVAPLRKISNASAIFTDLMCHSPANFPNSQEFADNNNNVKEVAPAPNFRKQGIVAHFCHLCPALLSSVELLGHYVDVHKCWATQLHFFMNNQCIMLRDSHCMNCSRDFETMHDCCIHIWAQHLEANKCYGQLSPPFEARLVMNLEGGTSFTIDLNIVA